nr:embryonic stem cell-specific 5-hydroxymethylcytosine-binding protein isoform X4 [Oryza sativa Japonica Group]
MFRMMRCSDHFTLFFSGLPRSTRCAAGLAAPLARPRPLGLSASRPRPLSRAVGLGAAAEEVTHPLCRCSGWTGRKGVLRYRPSYNVSPGTYLPVGTVRARPAGYDGGGDMDGEVSVIQCMKWGLVPSFTGKNEKPDHFRMFNARSESIKEKASFRRLIPNNRCLVAVEGFYEWKKDGPKKMPYYIHFQDQRPLVFAALFDTWTNSEGETIHTFTILTTRASISLKWLHDRMPVILGDKDSISTWLNGASVKLEEITVPYEGADLDQISWHALDTLEASLGPALELSRSPRPPCFHINSGIGLISCIIEALLQSFLLPSSLEPEGLKGGDIICPWQGMWTPRDLLGILFIPGGLSFPAGRFFPRSAIGWSLWAGRRRKSMCRVWRHYRPGR